MKGKDSTENSCHGKDSYDSAVLSLKHCEYTQVINFTGKTSIRLRCTSNLTRQSLSEKGFKPF